MSALFDHSCVVTTLCILSYIPAVLTNTDQVAVIIRGQNEFVPCTYERDPSEPEAHILICDEEASREFGNQLPIIQADQIPLSGIQIRGTTTITRCPNRAFQDINLDVDRARGHLGNVVRRIEISGTGLNAIEPHCLDGLFTVRELRILNAIGSEYSEHADELARNLFHGLQGLRNLEVLHLAHIDLSAGIPAQGLGNWTDELRQVLLERNRLGSIDADAFQKSGKYRSVLRELRIEGQTEAWRLVKNIPQWARSLTSLKTLSWQRSELQPPVEEGIVRMDLGEVNSILVTLILDDCGLVRLVSAQGETGVTGLSLDALGPYLRELSLNGNSFASTEPSDQSLAGLRAMRKLELLRLEDNLVAIDRLPEWFAYAGLNELRELRLRKIGLTIIPANAFPPALERIHLSANPLRYVDPEWMGNNRERLIELHLNHVRLASVDVGGHWADWTRALKPIAGTLQVLSLSGCQIDPDVLEPSARRFINGQSSPPNRDNTSEIALRLTVRLGLNNLKQLRTLVLAGNELTYIPNEAFLGLTRLKHIVLADNLLGSMLGPDPLTVGAAEFSSTPRHRLQRLDIRFNQFQTLNRCASMFGLGESLEDMLPQQPIWYKGESTTGEDRNLEPRLLSEIHDDLGSGQNEWFGGLSLTGNQFVCDCRLAWLRLYISQMDEQVMQNRPDEMLPLGYRAYRTEALDFVCADLGPWRGRKFLTLKPIDLYAVRHEECQKYPDIYGDGVQIEKALTPCRVVIARHAPEAEMRPRGRILMTPGVEVNDPVGFALPKAPNRTKIAPSKKKDTDHFGISLEAFVLVVVASVASLCFVIISIIIILWLCWRLKRQESWQKNRTYSRGRYSTNQPRCNPFTDCCGTSECCSGRQRHSAGTTVTQSSNSTATTTALKPLVVLRNPRHTESSGYAMTSADLSDTGTVYEEPVDSYCSQMSDSESVPKNSATMRPSNRTRPVPVKRRKRHERRQPLEVRNNAGTNGRDSGLRRSDPHTANVEAVRHPSAAISGNHADSMLSLEQDVCFPALPPRSAPLPPVPAQRKTKSSTDIHQDIGQPDWEGRQRPKYKLSLQLPQEPRQPEHAVSLNALSQVERKQIHSAHSDTRSPRTSGPTLRVKQWSELGTINRHTDGSIGGSSTAANSDGLLRTRLTQSTGSRNRPTNGSNNHSPGWIRASRRKLERSFDWLRRTARRNGRTPETKEQTTRGGSPHHVGERDLTEQLHDEEDSRCMQGPDLPRPQIVLIPNIPGPMQAGSKLASVPHEYLPMQGGSEQGGASTPVRSIANTSKPDEYVTDFAERPVEIVLPKPPPPPPPHQQLSHHRTPPTGRRPLRLSANLYTISMYDEDPDTLPSELGELDLPPPPLPPPPPPPPPPSKMSAKYSPKAPRTGQAPRTHPTPANEPRNANRSRGVHPKRPDSDNTAAEQPLDEEYRRPLPPPIGPKPHNLEQTRTKLPDNESRDSGAAATLCDQMV